MMNDYKAHLEVYQADDDDMYYHTKNLNVTHIFSCHMPNENRNGTCSGTEDCMLE